MTAIRMICFLMQINKKIAPPEWRQTVWFFSCVDPVRSQGTRVPAEAARTRYRRRRKVKNRSYILKKPAENVLNNWISSPFLYP